LSIIIPVGPGDIAWRGLVEQLLQLASRGQILLVFADGDAQSTAVPDHCVALSAPAGRAHQLNAGIAAAAGGEWLWLLHADSRLQADTWQALIDYLATTPRALGWFRLAFDHDGPWLMALNALGANLRARFLGLPFGDQGFVLHRDDAARLGLFDPALAFGEDHAMVWRTRRLGLPLRRINGTLMTSARKYAAQGWWRTTMRHLRLTAHQAKQESRRT
jgi:GT2 family glycosyltransferase